MTAPIDFLTWYTVGKSLEQIAITSFKGIMPFNAVQALKLELLNNVDLQSEIIKCIERTYNAKKAS